jgi:four helix bundle protein
MSTINKFEDILAWQKAREMIKSIYELTDADKFSRDFTLKNQILSASFSIMLNIAEGFGRRTDKEFNNFLGIAHGSTAEVQSALYIALDRKYIEQEQFQNAYNSCCEISKMLMGLMKYLGKK